MKSNQALCMYTAAILLLPVCIRAQEKASAGKRSEINVSNLVGTWWIKHALGSLDGYQLERDGRLVLVNLHAWYGDRWELRKDTMTWVMYADKQRPEAAKYLVSDLTAAGFTLTPLTTNAGKKQIPLYKHRGTKVADAWVGRWTGVEGSFLDIVPDVAGYKVEIGDSGKLSEYRGKAENDGITFTRNGVAEYIGAVDGKKTGVASFEMKRNCLMIQKGKGYYRD